MTNVFTLGSVLVMVQQNMVQPLILLNHATTPKVTLMERDALDLPTNMG